ncbi:Protein Dom3Z [Ooceraea biroi]|nr:Protein Dom3Z [Ooceraea biroi]
MVADHPSHVPDSSLPLNECEEFHCIFKANFGDHSLLYGAEMDGIFSKEPITDTLIGKTIEFVELKTFPMFNENGDIRGTISSQCASAWWSQNYLANISKLICGLKDKSGTVRMIREYPTNVLPTFPTKPYNVDKCKMFCKLFLDNVKRIVTQDHDKCMYKFHWNSSTRNIISYNEEAPDNETYFFLKSWFISKAEEYRNASQNI